MTLRALGQAIVTSIFAFGIFCLGVALSAAAWAQQPVTDRALHAFNLAIKANDFSFFARMDRLGLGTATRDSLGNNLLMIGIREGGIPMMLQMLEDPQWQNEEVLNHENQLGETALMLAAFNGQDEIVARLITVGAQVNRAGWSALHYAASSGHVSTIGLLLEHHAFVDAESPNGTTPLMMAARFNHSNAAMALLQAGADPTMTNEAGFKARDYAVEANNKDLEFFLNLEEISFENRMLQIIFDTGEELSLEEIVIEAGGSVVVEPVDSRLKNLAPAVEGTELFQGIR